MRETYLQSRQLLNQSGGAVEIKFRQIFRQALGNQGIGQGHILRLAKSLDPVNLLVGDWPDDLVGSSWRLLGRSGFLAIAVFLEPRLERFPNVFKTGCGLGLEVFDADIIGDSGGLDKLA